MFYVWYIYLPTFYHKDQLNVGMYLIYIYRYMDPYWDIHDTRNETSINLYNRELFVILAESP